MDDWRRLAAPAAFLLAVTVAVILVRSGLHAGGGAGAAATTAPTTSSAHRARVAVPPPKKAKPAPPRYTRVRPGDTFSVIARRTGVSLARIEALNPGVSSTSLAIGQRIRIG